MNHNFPNKSIVHRKCNPQPHADMYTSGAHSTWPIKFLNCSQDRSSAATAAAARCCGTADKRDIRTPTTTAPSACTPRRG
uniref:Uncharacterized protein n=1 Tax=Trichogramma kaykai TaxID=54128 RepID=A0ABD2W2X3_9HYME